ncbi:MAG: Gfo/Idh/MocA family oxidoreductase [Elusimicrobiota bacterium]
MKKLAIVGFGAVCENAHAKALNELKDIITPVCVFDLSKERIKKAVEILKVVGYESLDEMIEKEKIDVALVSTPPSTHKDIIIKLLEKGIDVLCEKPLCVNLSEFDEISDAVYSNEKIVYTVHNWKYSPHILKIKELIPEIGELKYVEWKTLRKNPSQSASYNWRIDPRLSGGGIVFDHGWHVIYILNSLIGKRICDINAQFDFTQNLIDEVADLTLVYEDKTIANIHLSWKSCLRKNFIFAYGSKGILIFDDDIIKIEKKDGEKIEFSFDEKLSASSAHPLWTKYIYMDFIKAIDDRGKFEENFDEARQCIKTIMAGYKYYDQRKDKAICN